ncbi:MAG: acyl-CoA synthetase (AMP-forming)/AMP-acid ligase II [Glaciecola sp.]|jgi:acyl-CoA synthetase (AMP-forming)/AMP-acid ligase II
MTLFFEELARFGHNIACIEGDTTLTYAQLQAKVDDKKQEVNRHLLQNTENQQNAQGAVGDKYLIAIVANNSIATLVNYLAVLQLKQAIIFLTQAELETARAETSANVIHSFQPDIIMFNDELSTPNHAVNDDANTDANTEESTSIHPDVALLLSTSGSTGESKQVVLSYENLQANCQSICAYLPILPGDVTITTLPFQYSYGLSIINTHLATGATIILTELSFMQREFWDYFQEYKVTSFGGVPHSYDMLLRLKFTQKDLPHLRYFTQAGGKLAANKVTLLSEYATKQDKAFYVMYGQTEATARMSYVSPSTLTRKANTIGKAIPNTQLMLVDEVGNELKQAHQQGQLVFKGKNVMLGYAKQRSELDSFNRVLALNTGDLGYMDEEGDFFITGRLKRIVKIFGERVSLDQLEDLVQQHLLGLRNGLMSSVEAQVAAVGDDKIINIALKMSDGAAKSVDFIELQQILKKAIQSETGIHPSALKIVKVEALPLLPNGKTHYRNLQAMLMGASFEDYQQQFDLLMHAKPFGLDKAQKEKQLVPILNTLHQIHVAKCNEYHRIFAQSAHTFANIDSFPFIAVRLFKHLKLSSIRDDEVFRVLNSSGTTGQSPARIFLDKATSARQSKTLVNVMQSFIGKQRLAMLVIDSEGVAKGTSGFSARTAGIQGMAFFGRKPVYALHEDMQPNWPVIDAFFEQNQNTPILIFGFTFMVWQHFVQALNQSGRTYNADNAILVHSGGWKKLESQKVDNPSFKRVCREHLGNIKIHNFYGMAEQVGSVFVECESGYLHAPNMADIVIRNPYDLSVQKQGDEGLIQVISVIPTSYPGFSILTEDRGRILGEDDCSCGRKGKYFEVLGRLPKVELRGCSDTHEPS